MKNALFAIVALLTFYIGTAQKTEVELVRAAFRLEKKAVVAKLMDLNDSDSEKFWDIYEKYEAERTVAGTRRIHLIETYANKYEDMDEATTDALVKESIAIQKKELSLREKYYKMIKKNISTITAARFYQIEDAIQVSVLNELNSEIPLLNKKL